MTQAAKTDYDRTLTQAQVEQALLRLSSAIDSPRTLTIGPQEQADLHQAVDRVHAQLLGEADAVLSIAIAGCTGAGKSTLINALAGSNIAEASDRRPCTMQTRVYHHREVPAGGLPQDLAQQATFVAHDRPELRHKVIVDTPDLDTFHTKNRAATQALLKAAGLVIYVFSPERYAEERAWSVIRQEQRFSTALAVINKADSIAPQVLQKIAGEIRQRFAEMGKADIRVLCISAANHVVGATGTLPAPPEKTLDEFITLRAYIEHELQAGDLARMIRQQRGRVLEHLQQQVANVLPADALSKLDGLESTAAQYTREATQDLAEQMHEPLLAVEADLAPLVIVRKHQRFWGPFRTWLAIADFLRYGLPRMVRQLRVFNQDGATFTSRTLADQADRLGDAVGTESRSLQDYCFQKGLPVERWQAITADIDGRRLLEEVTRRIESRFESLAVKAFRRNTLFIWTVSFLGWALPAGLVIFALVNLLRQFVGAPLAAMLGDDTTMGRFFADRPAGTEILWNVVTLVVLSYLLLHMLSSAVLSGRNFFARSSIARQSLDETLERTVAGWLTSYRKDLEGDLADMGEPLVTLQHAVEGTIIRPSQVSIRQVYGPPQQTALPGELGLPLPAENANKPLRPDAPETTRLDEPQASPAELLRRSMQPPRK